MKICIVGLGYVGLPLAVALSRYYDITGFDVNAERIKDLKNSKDLTKEVSSAVLSKTAIHYSNEQPCLQNQDIYIVTVPTPVDDHNKPDLSMLIKACQLIGPFLRHGAIVVFESTVYPGVTENICGKELEKSSGLVCGVDFFLGYSPERINPGDKIHTVDKITKVVAGQNSKVEQILGTVYNKITKIFLAKDIKTAEAAKVIENAQRDINIAFMNEITMIFDRLGISTYDVLEAAKTKWNFLPFTPGLVGGHCIGVDPFYLAECAKLVGVNPEVILAGRSVNDGMGPWIGERIHKELNNKPSNILVLGLTFKENVPDLRNTKVVDIIETLKNFGHKITVVDPLALSSDAKKYYQIDLESLENLSGFDCIIGAVSHEAFYHFSSNDFERLGRSGTLVVDIKKIWNKSLIPCNQKYLSL